MSLRIGQEIQELPRRNAVIAMENWTVVYTAIYPQDVYMAQSLLESDGIFTFIKDELTAQVHNFYSTAIGGVKLMVRESDVHRAVELLTAGGYIRHCETKTESASRTKDSLEVIRTVDRTRCPYCGSDHIYRAGGTNSTSVALTYFFSIPLPFRKRTWQCWECGRRWKFGY